MKNDIESAVLSVSECARYLKISRGSAYQGIAQNSIPHVKIGRRILVSRRALEKMLEGQQDAGENRG